MTSVAISPHPTVPNQSDSRPGLAILSNSIPPYTIHLHRLIADRIPELKLHTLVSHRNADFDWHVGVPASIHVTNFGEANDSVADHFLQAPRSEWRKGSRMIRYVRENNVQALICNGYRYISYLRLMRYCHGAGIPVFVRNDSNIRGDRNLSAVKRFLKPWMYATWLRYTSGVMSMSEYGDQFFVRYGADPQKLYRVPCVPDYDAYAHVEPGRLDQFRRKFGLSAERRYLLFSGRLIQLKRVDLIIDALAHVAAERPEWDLLIVGDGVLGDELRRRVPEPLRSRVIWTGFLDGDDPSLAYHAADVLLLPSDKDAWGLVVQEAMAAGLVVVATDVVGAAHELIDDGKSGRLIPAGDLAELKRAILQVTAPENLARFQQESTAALARWREELDPIAEIRRALVSAGVLSH